MGNVRFGRELTSLDAALALIDHKVAVAVPSESSGAVAFSVALRRVREHEIGCPVADCEWMDTTRSLRSGGGSNHEKQGSNWLPLDVRSSCPSRYGQCRAI